jgi:hypothetical protein
MHSKAEEVDALLRGGHSSSSWRSLAATALMGSLLYGAVMGAYGLRPLQCLYSSLKVPLLLGGATLLCIPNFLVVNTLLGLRDDLRDVIRGVLSAAGTVSVVLASLAPLTALHYVSAEDYADAIVINGLMFFLASLGGQVTLARHYRVLIARNPRHRLARNGWLLLYVFVATQMAWMLRPFVGDPAKPTQFLRTDAWGNAYVEVATIVWRALTR